ncbi:hypothetical protein TYRP_013737 [Tyrophagus putrescentiae]|nr:hypothetical protein TYRP_013737 [Tyrophagus putrescentiae]
MKHQTDIAHSQIEKHCCLKRARARAFHRPETAPPIHSPGPLGEEVITGSHSQSETLSGKNLPLFYFSFKFDFVIDLGRQN